MVKVSVLVTCYNQERYIRTALESVLAQQVSFPYEVVVCDDASSDGTRAFVAELAVAHPERVRLFLPEQNLGYRGAEIFMRGMQMCRGEYIASLDGDDYWTAPDKLQMQADFLDAQADCSLCFHNVELRYEDGSLEPWNLYASPHKERMALDELLAVTSIHTSTLMFRRELVSDFEKWRETAGPLSPTDWAMAVLAARHGSVGYIDRVMAVYLQHGGGVWSAVSKAGQLEWMIGQFDQMDQFLDGRYHETIEKAVCARSYEAAIEEERLGDLRRAGQHLARCLQGRPEWLDPYVAASGFKREDFWAMLSRRLWLYRHPVLFRLSAHAVPLNARAGRMRAKARILLRRRLRKTEAAGFITASPNPAPESTRHPRLAATTLTWSYTGTENVEVHVGTPDGPLFCESDGPRTKPTGEWVQDGMLFYLQNVSEGRPLTPANTLDVVRVSVRLSDHRKNGVEASNPSQS